MRKYIATLRRTLCVAGLLAAWSGLVAQYDPSQYFPVELVNNTNIASDEEIYVIMKALDPATGNEAFLAFDAQGVGAPASMTADTHSFEYSYKLSDLPVDGGKRVLYIPRVESGRMYISIGYPMDMHVSEVGSGLKIPDPDGFNPQDSNYYTLYDKVEFSYTDAGTWMNPTAVDFFSLPIRIEQSGSSTGYTTSGFYDARSSIFEQIRSVVSSSDKTTSKVWDTLFLNYTSPDNKTTLLRFMSPGKAMVMIPNTRPFDQHYLDSEPTYGINYMDVVWDYYRTNTIRIDCSELINLFAMDDYILTGRVVGDNFEFVNQSGTYSISIPKPDNSMPFFAGAGGVFDAENNTPKAIIVRQITSAFEVGLLPAANNAMVDRAYFDANRDIFYNNSAFLPQTEQGPWYDLYSKALHSFGEEQPIYTFAYDDALGQDGTLHDPNANNLSTAVITIGDLSGTNVPNPYADDTIYTVTPFIGDGSTVIYNGKPLEYGESIEGVTIPFTVTVNGEVANIYIRDGFVRPYYDGAYGIVIDHTNNTAANITFPGVPKAE
ncbi:MAG: hypothetical protein Tsb0018_02580 [Opitutales bacterium]|tara:strand:- start:5942 stop:7582 length:1641 start_codon:yes stop_codon:yes gene_type:complete